MTTERSRPSLSRLRTVYAFTAAALLALGCVRSIVTPFGTVDSLLDPIYALVPLGFLIGQVMRVLTARVAVPKATADPDTVAAAFVTRFFLVMAFAELPVLIGFAVTGVGAGGTIRFWVAVAIGAVPFALAAPNDRSLDAFQAKLIDGGSPVDLRAALGA